MSIWAGLDLNMAGDSGNKIIKNFRFEALSGTDRPSASTYDPSYHKALIFYDEDNENILFGRDAKEGTAAGFYVIADTTSTQALSNKTMQSVVLDTISRNTGDAIIDDLTTVTSPTDKIASIAGIKSALAGYIASGLTLSGHITGTESGGDIPTTIQSAAITDQTLIASLAQDDVLLAYDLSGTALGKTTVADLKTAINEDTFLSSINDNADGTFDFNLNDATVITLDIVEATQDIVNGLLIGGTNVSLAYDDVANTLTINGAVDTGAYWNLKTGGTQRKQIGHNDAVDFVGGTNISVAYGAGGIVTINNDYTYTHPTGFSSTPDPVLTDLSVISQVVVNSDGHVTGTQTRELPASTITDGQGLTWTHDTVNNILTADVHLTPFTTDDLQEGATNLYFHNELVDDRVAQLLNAGTGIILNYSDATNTLTISADLSGVNYWTKTGSDLKYIDGNVYIGEDGNASDLYVWGSIYQNGDPYILEAEHIRTSDEFMVLRYDAAAAIGAGNISGLEITKYDGTNNLLFGTGSDGWFRIGETGALQLIATRDENANIVDGNLLVLDEDTNKLIDSGFAPSDFVTPSSDVYLSGLSFNTADGVLTATLSDASTVTEDLDGRYALISSLHDAVTLTSDDTAILSLSGQALTFVSTNIAKLDRAENNFTGIVDAASFKQANTALVLDWLKSTSLGTNGQVGTPNGSGGINWVDLTSLPGNGGGKYKTVAKAATSGTISQADHGFAVGSSLEVTFWYDNGTSHEPYYGVEVDINKTTGDITWSSNPSFKGYITIKKMTTAI